MAKRIWEFQSLSQIGDDTKFLVSQGENTRVVPGALINQISNRIDSIIKGTSDAVSAAEIADARVQPNGQTAETLGAAIRWIYTALTAIDAASYEDFGGGVSTAGKITVTKKCGICCINGSVTLNGSVSGWVSLLDSTEVPAPQTGEVVIDTLPSWKAVTTVPARLRIPASGGLQITAGSANAFWVNLAYPVL